MRAGTLNKRIRFERPSEAVDKYGAPIGDWEVVSTVWAAIRPMGSNERMAALQMQSSQTHVVTTRYSAALAQARGEWRIVFGARVLQLVGQPRNPDERNESLVFDCTEGPAQ
ncbi:MAG: phage head closure protein [Acidovorax sp.]|nr:phage head closure protein [Acidovorax sp.]